MPRSSNDDYMDYYGGSGPSGGPGGSAGSVGQGGLGGSHGSGGRSAGGGRSSGGYGGSGGSSYGNDDAGGRSFNDSPFSGSGVSDYGGDGGSSYGQHGAGNVSAAGSGNRGGRTDPGNDGGYFAGQGPSAGAVGMGGLGGSVGRGLGGSRSGYAGGLGGNIGGGLGSRSTYGNSNAGGLAVSGQVGRGLGGGRSLADAYGQAGRSMAAGGVRGLGAPGRDLTNVERARIGATTTMPMEMAALLAAVAIPESRKDWAAKFRDRVTDFTRHPGNAKTITRGHTKGLSSSAAGAFQFIQDTYKNLANRLGLTDFSPRSQTIAAVSLAKELYANHGRNHSSLEAAIEARDFADIKGALGKTNSRGHSIGWEGVTIQSADRLSRNFENELASLKADTDIRTDANVTESGQVFTNPDGSKVATPTQATFETRTGKGTDQFTNQVYGYLTANGTEVPTAASATPNRSTSTAVTDEYPTPFNTERSGFNREHDLELRTAPANVELEDLPGNEHLSAPSIPPSTEPKESTFEETFLEPAEATSPNNTPMPTQRGASTVRDVVVPQDWQRPSGDPWAGMREGDVGYANSPQGDPWDGLRDAMAESGIEGLPFKPVAAAVDTALSFIPGIGWVNLGAKLVTGESIGEYVARNGIKTEITFPSVGEPGSDEVQPIYRSGVVDEGKQEPEDEAFESIYLSGNHSPTPAVRWGRRAA